MSAIDVVTHATPKDLGTITVRRALPSLQRRRVGPFVFLDHIGPVDVAPGNGMDVRPHPHIGLATVTFLFEGEIMHRDNLGTTQEIVAGDVNWMVAGKGIVHSERASDEARKSGIRLHGLQSWVALPKQNEEGEPSFVHHPRSTIPTFKHRDAEVTVIAGHLYGIHSPVAVFGGTLYASIRLPASGVLGLTQEHVERALYVIDGEIECHGDRYAAGSFLVFHEHNEVAIRAERDAHFVLLGGAPLDGDRHVWWNFVSSSEERIERAKEDWKAQRAKKIPGDDREFAELPDR